MSSNSANPDGGLGGRVGPVFCTKDQYAFVKMSKEDNKRAVVNTNTMTLVDYIDKREYPEGAPLRSDQSLFVPIYCKECYGTSEDDYTEALSRVVSCGSDRFLVGMCSVFGVAQGEVYPDSRKDFIVGNDLSYSGACHPQPGQAVFLHKVKKDIGRVKCYWHVHSRSVNKTFLYCCVACDDTEYANGVVKPDMSMGFSLGTVGDNESGPLTEECSLVPVPMRPGCFCTLVSGTDVAQTMTRMGFSTLKDSLLDAGLNLNNDQRESSSHHDESSERQTINEAVESLREAVLGQAAEMQALKDVLEAMKVQNGVLTQTLKCPHDPDSLFTVQGAEDFTRRTGVKTKLCAGVKPTREDTNIEVTDPTGGDTPAPEPKQMEEVTPVSQAQMDNLIKLLLLQQQQLQQLQQQQHQQHRPHQQQQQQQQQQQRQLLQQQHQQRQQPGREFSQDQTLYNPSSVVSQPGVNTFSYGTLTEEQRRNIAMEFNKEESERQAISQKQQEKMVDLIKTSLRDILLEQQYNNSSGSWESSCDQSTNMDKLKSLARDTPYKRGRKQANENDQDPENISTLLKQLHKLTKDISKHGGGGSSSSRKQSCDEDTMEMDGNEAESPSSASNDRTSEPYVQQPNNTSVTNKQQAGYSLAPSTSGGSNVTDFISAVVTKM
ncbi:hypothetical protein D5F01_LYC23933 [Larimichthys crocea]|uniref:ORF28 N-terminal domain-containing protein n=1 Tax=Larimichthys crocea TaxID=215358 RepID=A0A6G0HFI1_LARCR|nr:hypothetical protein D5F01_LYC23933 [Larimichthys crocea]